MERQWFSMVAYHWPNDPIVEPIVLVVRKNPLPLVPIANERSFYIGEIFIGLDGVAMVFNGSEPSAK